MVASTFYFGGKWFIIYPVAALLLLILVAIAIVVACRAHRRKHQDPNGPEPDPYIADLKSRYRLK